MDREIVETIESKPTPVDREASILKKEMPTLAGLTSARCILMFEIEKNSSASMIGVAFAAPDRGCADIGGAHQILRYYEKNYRQGWRINHNEQRTDTAKG